jgi:hypothetical protein
MRTGYCDSNWTREYHDLWYEEVKDSAEPVPEQQALGIDRFGVTGSKPPAFLSWVNNCFGCYCVFEIIYYAVYSVRAAEVDFGRILQKA